MTREDEDKMTQERYALGPNGKRVTVEQALSRAERAETQMAAEYARGVADERARVAAWLRDSPRAETEARHYVDSLGAAHLALAIERGEHEMKS